MIKAEHDIKLDRTAMSIDGCGSSAQREDTNKQNSNKC